MLSLFLAIVGFVGYYFINKVNDNMTDMYVNRLLPVKQLNEIRAHSRAAEAIAYELLLVPVEKVKEQELLRQLNDRIVNMDKQWADYTQTKLDPYEVERVDKFKATNSKYRIESQKAIDMATAGQKREAYLYFMQNANAHLEEVNKLLIELADYNAKVADQLNTQGDKDAALINKIVPAVTMAAIVAALILGTIISRTITVPLGTMLRSIAKDANGYITIKETDIRTKDEIGALANSLNILVGQVRTFVDQVAESAEQLAASYEELTASSEQSAEAANQVAASLTIVSQGADMQLQSLEETASAVGQMSAAIQQMAANATVMLQSSEKTRSTADEGRKAAHGAVSQMTSIEQAVTNSAVVIGELGEQSKAIGKIVTAISSIAAQTNLLALNAAIEAARAGEHGRGFAVVAEEVRKLAEQSQESAKQIAELLGKIQQDAENAVISMEQGTREVKLGSEVVNKAGESFAEIALLVTNVSSQISEVSAAVQQMAASSQQVVNSVQDIERISRDAASQTQNVSASTEEQSASVQEIAASSQSLAKMAQDLQVAVAGFRI